MRTFYRMETIEINFLSHPTPEHLARLTMLTAMLEKKNAFLTAALAFLSFLEYVPSVDMI